MFGEQVLYGVCACEVYFVELAVSGAARLRFPCNIRSLLAPETTPKLPWKHVARRAALVNSITYVAYQGVNMFLTEEGMLAIPSVSTYCGLVWGSRSLVVSSALTIRCCSSV